MFSHLYVGKLKGNCYVPSISFKSNVKPYLVKNIVMNNISFFINFVPSASFRCKRKAKKRP